jgi:hypothetical protein
LRQTLAAVAALVLLVAGCGADDLDADATSDAPGEAAGVIATDAEPDAEVETDPEDDGADDADDGATDDGGTDAEPAEATDAEPDAGGTDAEPTVATDDEPTEPSETEPGPTPDPAALEDPCAEHDGREADGFIEVVAPVDGQEVDDEVELVGCSNVFEATISYRLHDDDGTVFDEGFTTAECGSGCVGAFRETIDLSPAGDQRAVFLRVWSQNMDDAGEPELFPVDRVVIRD